MLLLNWALQLSFLFHVVLGLQLFDGNPYVGSAEQHAELDAITAAAKARRAEYAAPLRSSTSQASAAASADKHNGVSQATLDHANKIVDAAIARWTSTYRPHILRPRRSTYKSGHKSASRHQKQWSAEPLQKVLAASGDDEIFSAAAFLAEVEAAERARSGSLYRDYTVHAPGSPIQKEQTQAAADQIVSGAGADNTFWLEQLAAGEHGHAPFAGDANYKDDTAAINKAIADGKRCGASGRSGTTKPALIYFPAGTYLVSSTIVGCSQTQLVGNPNRRPTIRAASKFVGKDGTTGVISSDVYVDRGGGQGGHSSHSNFYRQVRNLIIDIMDVKAENASCIHWQAARATSIENVACHMSDAASTTQRGIFSENGSGGWMADLEFSNGQIGIYGGVQQFTAMSIQFVGCKIGGQLAWDSGSTWRSIYVSGADVAFKLFASIGTPGAGSFLLQDATIFNCTMGVLTLPPKSGETSGTTSIILDTVAFDVVASPVADPTGHVLLPAGSDPLLLQTHVWFLGNHYVQGASVGNTRGDVEYGSGTTSYDQSRPPGLIAAAGDDAWSSRWYKFQRRPQYEKLDVGSLINIRDYGAKGDGVTDDTQAFKAVFSHVVREGGGVVFVPHGVYLIADTIELGAGVRVVGECWSQLMAKGSSFSGLPSPKVFIRVGRPAGDVGLAEMSDLLVTASGAATHLVGLEWNVRGSGAGTAAPGIYDVHVRIGGAAGTDLQAPQCPRGQGTGCRGGLLMMHITPRGAGYFQNVWAWAADHDMDDASNERINVVVARGWLVESTRPTWLYGTAAEHAVMYQYSFNGADTLSAGMIQAESGYFQGKDGIRNPAPFEGGIKYPGDPVLPDGGCANGTIGCDASWAVVILNSTNTIIDGAGLYSWFDAYDGSCVDSRSCQGSLVQIGRGSGNVSIRNLVTVGSANMISGVPGEPFLGIPAEPNLHADDARPGWSLLSSFQIVGTPATTVWPPNRNFFALGDAYASGIGADCGGIVEDQPEGDDCRKCRGAYAYQLRHNTYPFNGRGGAPSSIFKFFACAGATTGGIVDPPDPGRSSQVGQMKDYNFFQGFGFATLSVGIDDIGFSRFLYSCVFWETSKCDEELDRAQKRIASRALGANLAEAYAQIMDLAEVPDFRLFVTGYGRLFNEDTDWCSGRHLFPYLWWGRAALTRELRGRANALTESLNARIAAVVRDVSLGYARGGSRKRAVYIDTDSAYERFRWCDGLARGTWRDDGFFFNIRSGDYKPWHGTVVAAGDAGGPAVVVDIGGLDPDTCMDAADDAGDAGLMLRCAMAQQYADENGYNKSSSSSSNNTSTVLGTMYAADDGSGSTLLVIDSGGLTGGSGLLPAQWKKAFHPKTYPLANIAGRVFLNWYHSHPT